MQKESSASGSLPLSEFSLSVVQARGGAELLQTVRMKELVDTIDIADSTIRAQVRRVSWVLKPCFPGINVIQLCIAAPPTLAFAKWRRANGRRRNGLNFCAMLFTGGGNSTVEIQPSKSRMGAAVQCKRFNEEDNNMWLTVFLSVCCNDQHN